jgi:hypothetical protein
METVGSSETSETTLCHIPDGSTLHNRCAENVKSNMLRCCLAEITWFRILSWQWRWTSLPVKTANTLHSLLNVCTFIAIWHLSLQPVVSVCMSSEVSVLLLVWRRRWNICITVLIGVFVRNSVRSALTVLFQLTNENVFTKIMSLFLGLALLSRLRRGLGRVRQLRYGQQGVYLLV